MSQKWHPSARSRELGLEPWLEAKSDADLLLLAAVALAAASGRARLAELAERLRVTELQDL